MEKFEKVLLRLKSHTQPAPRGVLPTPPFNHLRSRSTIKRMFVFFNNEVINLHRLSMGQIVLDEDLNLGEFRLLTTMEVAAI